MDWKKLNFALDYLASVGTLFSVEQRVQMQSSLTILQKENQFENVHLVAKINGTERDYFIACGIGKDYLKDRTYFFSNDGGMNWTLLLDPISYEMLSLGQNCRGHFVGDPAADCETEVPVTDGFDDMVDDVDGCWLTIKEEERLSATLSGIMNDGAVIPRGALLKTPTGLTIENQMFEGLNKSEATQLYSYYHLRRPVNPWDKNIVVRSEYNISLDFLDPLAVDEPKGCWSLQVDKNETIAILRSLYWPGFVAYHVLETPNYGWFYVGTGKKNWDVPFMVLSPDEIKSQDLELMAAADYKQDYEETIGENENY